MGTSEAPRGGRADEGFPIAGLRRCLRPAACPYALGARSLAGDVRSWDRALTGLFPGDPELADELLIALLGMEPADLTA